MTDLAAATEQLDRWDDTALCDAFAKAMKEYPNGWAACVPVLVPSHVHVRWQEGCRDRAATAGRADEEDEDAEGEGGKDQGSEDGDEMAAADERFAALLQVGRRPNNNFARGSWC